MLSLPLLFMTLGFSLDMLGAAQAAARVGVLRGALNGAKKAYNNKWKLGVGAGFGYSYLDLWNKNKNFEQKLSEYSVNVERLGINQQIAEDQRNTMLKVIRSGKLTTDQKIEIMSEGLFAKEQPAIHERIMGVKNPEITPLTGTISLLPVTPYEQLRERLFRPIKSIPGAIDTMNQIADAKENALQRAKVAATAAFLKYWSDNSSPF